MTDTTTETPAAGPLATSDEDQANAAAAAGQAPAAAKTKTRPYGVYAEETIDTSDAEAIQKLIKHLAQNQVSITVLVKVGRAVSNDPRSAVQELGKHRDLDGDYGVIADNAITALPNVKSKLERTVAIGG